MTRGTTRASRRVSGRARIRSHFCASYFASSPKAFTSVVRMSVVTSSVVRTGPHPPSTPPPPHILAAWAAARATSPYPPPPCHPMVSRPSPTVLALTDSAPVKTGQKRQGGEGGAEGGKHRRTGGKNQREGGKGGEPTQRQPEPTQRQRSPRTNPLVIQDIEACRCNPLHPRTNDWELFDVFPPVGNSPSAANAPWFRLFRHKFLV